MKAFKEHQGIVATLNRANVDTDQIIPKQFLKSIQRTGFGPSLFYDWRYNADGSDNPEFELNQPSVKGASILVAGNNFGCGSSREHAVWAIAQDGYKVVVAPKKEVNGNLIPGFADIFKNNCVKNAILTIELSENEVNEIFDLVKNNPGVQAIASVERATLEFKDQNKTYSFVIDPAVQERLLQGLDDIGITLQHQDALDQFEKKHQPQL